jgi:broad specificity phosphatase PhoE
VVQAHPSGAAFPGEDGESMPDVQHRAVGAVREWNARLGRDATYLICSHGDVIKSLIADSLGMHLDLFQRIQVDPCSLTAIRYTPFRPFLVRMNDTGGTVSGLVKPGRRPRQARHGDGDAVIGGGAGG